MPLMFESEDRSNIRTVRLVPETDIFLLRASAKREVEFLLIYTKNLSMSGRARRPAGRGHAYLRGCMISGTVKPD